MKTRTSLPLRMSLVLITAASVLAASPAGASDTAKAKKAKKAVQAQTLVTGSNIATRTVQVSPIANTAYPLDMYGRTAITRSGAFTLAEFLNRRAF